MRGSHSIKAGFQLSGCRTTIAPAGTARYSSRNFSNVQTAGFNNGTLQNNTGNSYASYLLGDAELGHGQRGFRGDIRRSIPKLCLVDWRRLEGHPQSDAQSWTSP